MIDFLLILGGLVLLGIGGEGVVQGSVSIAKRMKLSTLLISTVIVGFGTSMPEMMVSVQAAIDGAPDIALGNVVGSNICNTVLVLGVAGLIYPIACRGRQIKRDVMVGVAAALFLALISFTGIIDRIAGALMVSGLALYLGHGVWSEKKKAELTDADIDDIEHKLILALPMAVVGIAMLMGGAKLLIMGAVSIASQFGVSEAVIGLTVVAFGTSLPELATAVVAAYKKHTNIIIGNVLGSNLFNILAVLGVAAVVHPIKYVGQIATQDVWIMLGIVTLLLPIVFIRKKICKPEAALFLLIYIAYMSYIAMYGIA